MINLKSLCIKKTNGGHLVEWDDDDWEDDEDVDIGDPEEEAEDW